MQPLDNTEHTGKAVEEQETALDFDLQQEQDGIEPEADALDILDDLAGVEVDGGKNPTGGTQPEAPAAVSDEERHLAAQMTAAVATGAIATGLELFVKPAKVTDQQRAEFAAALAPVLAKSDGTLPPWLARLLADWQEELALARKTVAIGWAIREQVKAERAKEILLPETVPGPKPRVRVPAEETSQEAA